MPTITFSALLFSFAMILSCAQAELPDIQSFKDKTTKLYSTDGNPKAKGVRLSFSYPKAWNTHDDLKPNVAQRFTNINSDSRAIMKLVIKEFPVDLEGVSDDDLKNVYQSPEAKKRMSAAGMDIQHIQATKWSGQRAIIMDYHCTLAEDGVNQNAACVELQIFYKGFLVGLQFMVFGPEDYAILDKKLVELTPTFILLSESIAFKDS